MNAWGKELLIGIVGSLIGAAIVYLFSFGFQWTKKSREIRLKIRKKELTDRKSGNAVKRQTISNSYLFSVLKFFVVGNILLGVSSAASDLEPFKETLQLQDYIQEGLDTLAVLFFLATFAKIIQFAKLLRMTP